MMNSERKIPDCPVELTLQLIGDKWKVLIIRDLMTGTKRFSELMKSVTGITQKVLTSHLRSMEADGLLTRKVYPEVPPRVEYTLTETGFSLKPIMDSMVAWGNGVPGTVKPGRLMLFLVFYSTIVALKCIGRITGEIGNQAVGIFQVKHFENRVFRGLVLALDDWIFQRAFLYLHIVLKNGSAVKANPGVLRAGDGHLHFRVGLHILVYLFGIVGAEPQFSLSLKTEHERTAFRLPISSNGCQVLHRICLQKFYYSLHLLSLIHI